MRKLRRFSTNSKIDLRESEGDMRFTNINDIKSSVEATDLMLSVLVDKGLNSTEKSIIGLFIEETLTSTSKEYLGYANEFANIDTFPSSIILDEASCIVIADHLTTKEIGKILNISMPTVFNNISSLKENGIISFERYKFGEFARISFNIGKLAYRYF